MTTDSTPTPAEPIPFKPETWPVDADGFTPDLCTECGTPVRYGSRHTKCAPGWRATPAAAEIAQPPEPAATWRFEGVPPPGSTCLLWVKPSYAKVPHYTVDEYGEQHEAPVSWSSATIPVGEGWDSFDHDDVIAWMVLEQSGPAAPASDADSMQGSQPKEN